jgi:hypothetical protein
MRRILFPALGVVVLLVAYAGQELAAGAPSAPRATAQTGFPVLLLVDQVRVLKHIAVAEDKPLDSLPAGHKTHRLVNDMRRFDAWIERKADEILADRAEGPSGSDNGRDRGTLAVEGGDAGHRRIEVDATGATRRGATAIDVDTDDHTDR